MKEFIEKLIVRLREKFKYNSEQAEIYRSGSDNDAYFREKEDLYRDRANTYGEVMRIVNRLAEEYNNEFCEWFRYDYRTIAPKNHDAENPYWRIPDNMDKLKYCPYCGKKIRVAPYQPKGE